MVMVEGLPVVEGNDWDDSTNSVDTQECILLNILLLVERTDYDLLTKCFSHLMKNEMKEMSNLPIGRIGSKSIVNPVL